MISKWLKRFVIAFVAFYLLGCFGLYFFQENFLFHPYPLSEEHEFKFSAEFQELDILSHDNIELNAIHFVAKEPRGLLIFFHGNTGNAQTCGPNAYFFLHKNWDVLMPDYREFGKTEGELSMENLFEDAQSIYDYAKTKYSEDNIIIYGQSIGTGIGSELASRNDPFQLILEAPYYSIEYMAKHQFSFFPIEQILKYKIETYKYLEKVQCTITAFHGSNDNTIPLINSIKLAEKVPNFKFIEVQQAGHNDVSSFRKYKTELLKILQ